MQAANTVTRADSLAAYQGRVQAELERAGVERDLTIAEVAFVAEQWQAGNRFDLCAALIRTDRDLAARAQQHRT